MGLAQKSGNSALLLGPERFSESSNGDSVYEASQAQSSQHNGAIVGGLNNIVK
jgi:hypothetical protein